MDTIIREYDAKLDRKNRLTIPGTLSGRYHVRELGDGSIILKPVPEPETASISAGALKEMDLDIKNLKADIAGAPVDLTESQIDRRQ